MQKSRSDARANRQRILEAANAVFAEKGMGVPLDAVIARADVGRATFYRSFADRTALIVGLMEVSLDSLEIAASRYAADGNKLFAMLFEIGQSVTKTPALADAWRFLSNEARVVERFQDRLRGMFYQPIIDAIEIGALRKDFSVEDVFLVAGMLGTVIRYDDTVSRAALESRILDFVTYGLAGPTGPLQQIRLPGTR